MSSSDEALQGTYRCPVCGHRDAVEVIAGAPALKIACTYCQAALVVSARDAATVRLDVQLAEAPVHG